jgi:mannose-6-phosphate isomerase
MQNKNNLFKLSGKVQHYQWGGDSFLPKLLDLDNAGSRPFAEYWLGAHENAPSEMQGIDLKFLDQYIQQHPDVLGAEVKEQFGKLPYLLKVLDVKDMLSIQVHPSKNAAVSEFEKENASGKAITAADRNYKDDNHKPELMFALSDFWLLHGFRPAADLLTTITAVPEFSFMRLLFEEGGYEKLYRTLMEMEQEKVNEILEPLLQRIIPKYEKNELKKDNPDFWAARAALTFNQPGKTDRGIFSVYLLNLVHLEKGESIFQDAGILHAYLEGQNVELMANSDNVLRGGLTPKHIDTGELMKHVSFVEVVPNVIHGAQSGKFEEVFASPAPDFQLSRFLIGKDGITYVTARTTEIFFVMHGDVQMKEEEGAVFTLKKGEAAVAFAGSFFEIQAIEKSEIFRASVPAGAEG